MIALFHPRRVLFAQSKASPTHFHLHPQYRENAPVEAALLQLRPGNDEFKAEEQHEKLASILDRWKAGLLESPPNISHIAQTLGSNFSGTSWQPLETRPLRPIASGLEITRLNFAPGLTSNSDHFCDALRSSLSAFSRLLTVQLQITAIELGPGVITTQIRYEMVGTGPDFHREQRVGQWLLEWEAASLQVIKWHSRDEVRSKTTETWYADIANSAFGGNPAYESQLLHGADYWRTLLDGACGIDIYGHNGVAVGDIDGDGYDDIYICQAAGLPNRLFRNRRDGTFEDITESAGVGILENTACALFADFNNTGWQDLLVVRASGPLLFLNAGNGKFTLKPDAFHFANPPQGTFTGAAAADYDRDGRLDVYFCLYSFYQGTNQYNSPTPYFAAENGPPNFLMRNMGDGTFKDVTAQSGLNQNNSRYSFCCGWSDYKRDGWPDLYVVNDFGKKNLYRNNGDGTFTDVAHELGAEDTGAGMSVCWLDYNNDGAEDLYVANMWTAAGERITKDKEFQKNATDTVRDLYRKHAMGNSLLENTNKTFRDATNGSNAGVGRWAWASDSWDFDHDGLPDLYITNGMVSGPIKEDLNSFFWRQVVAKSPDSAESDPGYEQGWNAINELLRSDYTWSGYERNILYANNGDGTFSDVSGALGLDFLEDGRAFALADFDGDGRQEMLIKNRNAPQIRLMKNVFPTLAPSISFRLLGTKSNRDAIGASITLKIGERSQTKLLQAGSGFLSQHSKEVFFGLGTSKGRISASIRWPSGLVQHLNDLAPDHRVWVTEGSDDVKLEPFKPGAKIKSEIEASKSDAIPDQVETWLLAPVPAPIKTSNGKPQWLTFGNRSSRTSSSNLEMLEVDVSEKANEDLCAIYNLLFRQLFDRHRDLPIPSSFLIDEKREIVKVYQGAVDQPHVLKDLSKIGERLTRALPFPGISNSFEFRRNYVSLGSVFFQRGYYEPSGEYFQLALAADPASAEASYGAGSVYLKQRKNAEARDCFLAATKSVASYPETQPNAWNNLGLLAARAGETDKAVQYFEKSLQLNPNHFVSLLNLGNAYKQQKRYEDALTTLQRAVTIKPSDAEAHYSLGMVYAQMDDSSRAFDCLQKALQLKPDYPEALNNLGVLYLRTRRRDGAVAAFEKCIEVAPGFNQAYLNLARVYAIEGDSEQARSVLRALLAQRPDDQSAKRALEELH